MSKAPGGPEIAGHQLVRKRRGRGRAQILSNRSGELLPLRPGKGRDSCPG